ncbi:VOC family protein [Streptomyces sp. NBC_00344]|uniref:VOC family protein n=1 Tax=Streptomyces sp. NBC_00344 TaxID=2975720 RepID=UPI00325604A0
MTLGTVKGETSSSDVLGAPCWVSLMARDLRSAQDFYGAVLGWQFRPTPMGGDFTLAVVDGAPVAGIGALAPSLQVAVAWTSYFAVDDADHAVARIRERSGTVAIGPLSFPVGRGAIAADRDGATFGIWEGKLPVDWPDWRRRTPAWLHLRTRDALEAAIFYGEVLDWANGRPGSCVPDYEGDEVVLYSNSSVLARLSSGAIGSAPDPRVRPAWHVHFPVADVAATVRAARAHGGAALDERYAPDKSEAVLRDPDGAMFTVTTRSCPG